MREVVFICAEAVCIIVACSALLVAAAIYWGLCELAKAIDRKEGR